MKTQVISPSIRTAFAMCMVAASTVWTRAAPPAQEAKLIPLVAILSTPAKFDAMKISVEGFVNFAPENAAIYISSEARRFALVSHAIWINPAMIDRDRIKDVNRKCCRVTGIFRNEASGPSGSFAGRIELQNVDIIVEEFVERRDSLVRQLGYIDGMLLERRDKLDPKEVSELEGQRKYLNDMLIRFEELGNTEKR